VTNSLLSPLIDANLAAAFAILAVLALRRRARALVGPRIAYGLWLVVPAAMLAILAPPRVVMVAAPASFASIPAPATSAFPSSLAQPNALAAAARSRPADMSHFLVGLWLAGSAASLVLLVLGQRRALRQFGSITADPRDPRLARATNPLVGPAVVGVFRPRLIVPADFEIRFDASERAMILAHEHTHLGSGHAAINALTALAQAVNWFNPLIHIAARYARTDQELACDAAVVSRFPNERRTYAQALLKTQLTDAPLPLGAAWPARSPTLLAERIEMLARKTPGRLRLFAGAAVVATLTVGAGVAAWSAEPPVRQFANPAGSREARSQPPSTVAVAGLADATPAPALSTAPVEYMDAPAAPGAARVHAQTGIVGRIQVEGNARIGRATILYYLPIQVGEPVDQTKLDQAMLTLTRTHLFADVRIKLQGDALLVQVVEDDVAGRLAEQQAPRQVVPFDPTHFDKYVGYYELSPALVFKIYRDGGRFFAQLTNQGPVEQFPESETKFFATVVAAQISFVTNEQGEATELVLHQGGMEKHAKRIDEATATNLAAVLAARVANDKPSPGTEDVLRRYVTSLANDQPNYDDFEPALAADLRAFWPKAEAVAKANGAVKAITFLRVGPAGNDVYEVDCEHAKLQWAISPLGPDGKVSGLDVWRMP
jgi:beta-lactamase regulating signal transducer with metallopeptidase domain